MSAHHARSQFQSLNKGYNSVFRSSKLSVGLVVPIERYDSSPVPTMEAGLERVQLAERLGFSSVWLRDVPFNVPAFGDAGQLYDPFVYLSYLAAQTQSIALGVASIVLPLRHPAHVFKSASSVDVLSQGRLIMGVASGDRPQEYPAMGMSYQDRGERFRDSFEYIRKMNDPNPVIANHYGSMAGDMDILPKSTGNQIPMLITGSSQQSPEWIAENGNGWMVYPNEPQAQKQLITNWNQRLIDNGCTLKPVMQPLYIDLVADANANAPPQPIHLGFRSGVKFLKEYLLALESSGINHVALNLRFNQQNIESTLELLSEHVVTAF